MKLPKALGVTAAPHCGHLVDSDKLHRRAQTQNACRVTLVKSSLGVKHEDLTALMPVGNYARLGHEDSGGEGLSSLELPLSWIAERLDAPSIGSGRCNPVVLECTPINGGTPALFVVKPLGFPSVTSTTCFRETLGTILARSLGVHVPDPGLINIDKTFVNSVEHLHALGDRRMEPGICFGSRYLGRGHYAPTANTRFDTDEMIDSAVRVFGFDLAFQNSDRQPHSPNCLVQGDRIVAFDFERAFEFTGWRKGGDIIPACYPNLLWGAKTHVFHRVASKQRARLGSFVDTLGAFDSKSLDTALLSLPADWGVNARRIIQHVQEIQNGLDTFRGNLLGVASPP